MHQGKYVFSQLMSFVSRYEFGKCVARYGGDYRVRSFTCWQQFLCMAFGQVTYRESLRDVVTCLNCQSHRLYHLGITSNVSLSTIADANESRDWKIYADLANHLITEARQLYQDEEGISHDLNQLVYSIDSSTIGLCLSVFPWAKFRSFKAGIKLHTQLDLRGSIPTLIHISQARVNDVNFLDWVNFESEAIYIMDKAYADLKRLYKIHRKGAFFVIRPRANAKLKRLYSRPKSTQDGIKYDQIVRLDWYSSRKKYPEKLRCVKFWDAEKQRSFKFLTNNFELPAPVIAELYKNRWQVELFFKWIKQHLKIKKLWGYSENAVKTQIWIAISTYLLVAIVKKKLKIEHSLYKILQILSISAFDKTPINQLLRKGEMQNRDNDDPNQLSIF